MTAKKKTEAKPITQSQILNFVSLGRPEDFEVAHFDDTKTHTTLIFREKDIAFIVHYDEIDFEDTYIAYGVDNPEEAKEQAIDTLSIQPSQITEVKVWRTGVNFKSSEKVKS